MAISSPAFPSLSPFPPLFSQERTRTRRIQLNASLDCSVPQNSQRKIKRQSYLPKNLSNSKFVGDFSQNQPIQADVEVPINESSKDHFLVSREIDSLGFSKEDAEKEAAKQAASPTHIEQSSNPEIAVSQQVESNSVRSEIAECSTTNGMLSKEVHQLKALVSEQDGIDPLVVPNFKLVLRIGALLLAQILFACFHFGFGRLLKEERGRRGRRKRE